MDVQKNFYYKLCHILNDEIGFIALFWELSSQRNQFFKTSQTDFLLLEALKNAVNCENEKESMELTEQVLYEMDNGYSQLRNRNIYADWLGKSKENVKHVIELIRKNAYHKCWNEKNFSDRDFLEICRTPIFLLPNYMNSLSGIFILLLVRDLSFEPFIYFPAEQKEDSLERANQEKNKRYRVINRCINNLKKEFNIDIQKKNPGQRDETLLELCSMYRFCLQLDAGISKKKHKLREDDSPYTQPIFIENMDQWEKSMLRIGVFKTLLLFKMNPRHQQIINHFMAYIKQFNMIFFILREEAAIRMRFYEKYKDECGYENIIARHAYYWQKIGTNLEKEVEEIPDDTPDDLYYTLFWKILAKELSLYISWPIKFSNNEANDKKINNVRLSPFDLHKLPDTAVLGKNITWDQFCSKYQAVLLKIFGTEVNLKDLEKTWELARKLLVYLEPGRFNFSVENDRFLRLNTDKKLTTDWYSEHVTEKIYYPYSTGSTIAYQMKLKEIIFYMAFIMTYQDVEWFWDKDADKIRKNSLQVTLDNIRTHYNESLINEIRVLIKRQKFVWFSSPEEMETIRRIDIMIEQKMEKLLDCQKFEEVLANLDLILLKLVNDPVFLLEIKSIPSFIDDFMKV